LATPNYGYEKRQRELAKKQKKEEKLRAKADKRPHDGSGDDAPSGEALPGSAPQGASDPSAPR
jgi:hypothetical protein